MSSGIQEIGAVPVGGDRVRFTVWAPKRQSVDAVIEGRSAQPLERGADGWFTAVLRGRAGDRYRYRLDGGDAFADPCSRYQPEGPFGPSMVVDPTRYPWGDGDWRGVAATGHVIYELHVGAFTREGTYAALTEKLPYLRELGVTLIELMPLHECPGAFNWGYDGACLFAPGHAYGSPDDLRRFIDRAHALSLGVILDVVYNHLGPDGNVLPQYADVFSTKYPAEWGAPLDFDSEKSRPVRDLVVHNACTWVREYHFDGLRLDATQNLFDSSPRHIVAELCTAVRAAAPERRVFLVGESEKQDVKLLEAGLDAIWVDDFHHVNRVIASGAAESYMRDYQGSARELVACVQRNSLYAGQYFGWQKQRRGTALRDVDPACAVFALQNHDQVANSLDGARLHQLCGKGLARALTALLLLAPQTPMLFMGQEHFAPAPFLFFVDHNPELMRQIYRGRIALLGVHESAKHAFEDEGRPLVIGAGAFEASKLDWSQVDARALTFHRELIALRRRIHDAAAGRRAEAAVLGPATLCLRWPKHLLVLDLAHDTTLEPPSEPLLAAPPGQTWRLVFSSELSRFGGRGAFGPDGTGAFRVQGRCATVLEAA